MKKHSEVDVITNSSGVIYSTVTVDAEDNIKEAINAVLEVAGSDKSFDDLFTIVITYDEWWIIDMRSDYNSMSEEEKNMSFEEYLDQQSENRRNYYNEYQNDHRILEICDKTGRKLNVVNLINSVYVREGGWDA